MRRSDMYGELPGDVWVLSSLSEAVWSFATKLSIIYHNSITAIK